jgi:metal-dependent hydrolase (beta-lactamase superfamily II)
LELDVTHQLLVYADDVDILCESKRILNQNTGNLLVVNMEIILGVNAEETKYIFMSHEHTNRKIKT